MNDPRIALCIGGDDNRLVIAEAEQLPRQEVGRPSQLVLVSK